MAISLFYLSGSLSSPDATSSPVRVTLSPPPPGDSSLSQAYNLVGLSSAGVREQMTAESSVSQSRQASGHNWPDDLMEIVQEPMGQTLDRMKMYSSSMSHVQEPPYFAGTQAMLL